MPPVESEELRELVADAWLARAPKRVARRWLAENQLNVDWAAAVTATA